MAHRLKVFFIHPSIQAPMFSAILQLQHHRTGNRMEGLGGCFALIALVFLAWYLPSAHD